MSSYDITKNTSHRAVPLNPRGPNWVADIEPFAWFAVLQRDKEYNDKHGPERIAVLFIGGDGHKMYDALYCRGDGTPEPFMIVVQDHGSGGNTDEFGRIDWFGRNGSLKRIARQCGQLPQWLLVAKNTEPWEDYEDCGADAEVGGMWKHPRRLYRRRN